MYRPLWYGFLGILEIIWAACSWSYCFYSLADFALRTMQTVVFRFLITVFPLIWSNFSRAFPFLRILKKYSSFLSCTIYNVTTCQYKLEPCGSGLVSCLHGVPIKPTNFYVACPEYQLTSEVFRTESTPLRPQNDTIIWDSLVGILPQFETG